MQRILMTGVVALFLSAVPAFAGERTVTLTVENMTCASCPYIVEQTLAGVPGVIRADVSFEDKTAIVTFDDAEADVATLTTATADMGYPSQPVEATAG
ncbi:MAG: mercury resistance system periplasmic binding protein MerP [Rhizobiales bacterium]|nr:mercury resistance system periplasmic binding protein MerP [Hyphomicrobiales bacterium]